ncbi:TadG family pilus assembly protein [Xylophilus sp. GW821-FHT01B05]
MKRRSSLRPPRSATRQRGSAAVLGALWITVALICLMSIDIGNIFWQRREAQRVADMAALAGAQRVLQSCPTAQQTSRESALLNARTPTQAFAITEGPDCGVWSATANSSGDRFTATTTNPNAVRVTVSRTVPYWFVFSTNSASRVISATATAKINTPLAALSIRNTLLTVDASRSSLLNAVIGGMLGGSLNLGIAGWQGLVDANINLLNYLDALNIELGLQAGNYDQLLGTQVSLGQLINAAITALPQGGNTAQITAAALSGLLAISAAVPTLDVTLGELLNLQTGTTSAGLNAGVQVLQLVQAIAEIANSKNAVAIEVPISLLGLANINLAVKVIEPAQFSSVGNPVLAEAAPLGDNKIYISTAQVRTLISVELPALDGVTGLLGAVTNLLSPVTTLLNSLLSLNLSVLGDVLSCVLACTKNVTDIDILPPPVKLDISLDAGNAGVWVTGHSCVTNNKSLITQTRTALADLRIGKLGDTWAATKAVAFATKAPPQAAPVPVLDIGEMSCTRILLGLIPVKCDEANRKAYYGGGLALQAQIPVVAQTNPLTFTNPNNVGQPWMPADYQAVPGATNIVSTVSSTLQGLNILKAIPAQGSANGGLANVLTALTNTLSGVISLLQGVVSGLLSPLLDPLLNTLLGNVLGIGLSNAEVGGQLTCDTDAELVQ